MIGVLGDRQTVCGFRMAGIRDCIETDRLMIRRHINELSEKRIIIINDFLLEELSPKERKEKIFIPVPGSRKSLLSDDIERLIEDIIGGMK